ncbi:hypothetical protein [Chromatocurvus halotolerans]|uniref:hypothetical protein n=1 Tax=Chromatocurvus halotolerans TaxID=1132028 RepID=UPI000E3E5A08|nr:hypothetical protein [Chromatocurvus halotolerans]
MFWLAFSILALLAAALVVYAAKPKKKSVYPARPKKPVRKPGPATSRAVTRRTAVPSGEPFEAVSIVPGLVPCPEARELRDHRFLIGQEPTLPLAGCSSKRCTCRLRQHQDRRNGGDHADRRLGLGLPTAIHRAEDRPERRRHRERRR